MGTRLCILILLTSVQSLWASQCDITNRLTIESNNQSSFLFQDVTQLNNFSLCDSFNEDDSYSQVKVKLGNIVASQTNDIYHIKDRHQMGNALNTCEPTKDSKAFVISFAGTGAYNPRTHSLLAKIIKCEKFQKLSLSARTKVYSIFLDELKSKNSAFTKWSGIDRGIMSQFISDSKLNAHAKNFDFAVFASEESELIAEPEKISLNSLSNITQEINASTQGEPKGIAHAKKCLVKYAMKSKELGIHPKLIVLSHSSGGRSVVKFLELVKENQIQADLVVTIDPVIEAQHAIQEVASQYAGRLRDAINPFTSEAHPIRVWSRKQPEKLYKTNAKEWVSFYQTEDSKGIGTTPSFGIYGSPVSNAKNYKIKSLGASGHGKICYSDEVIKKMKDSILKLFE